MKTLRQFVVLLAFVALLLAACNVPAATPAPTDPPPPTAVPTETTAPTATPVPPTATPLPTETPVPPTETPVPTETPDLAATESAQATETVAALFTEIDKSLKIAGITTADGGSLAWVQTKSNTIKLTTYGESLYDNFAPDVKHKNFAWRVKIGWDSSGGLAGCGLIFAGADDLEKGEHYRMYTLRLSGLPAWDIERWKFGTYQSNVTGSVRTSGLIKQESNAVNEYLIVANGGVITIYANGERMGSASDSRRTEGQFAFFAFQESGTTTCTFSDSWIWALP